MGQHEAAPSSEVDPNAFLEEHGIGEFADMEVEAHGRLFTVAQAIAECPPFAQNLRAMVLGLEAIPDESMRKTVLHAQVSAMGKQAAPEQITAANPQKKTTLAPANPY